MADFSVTKKDLSELQTMHGHKKALLLVVFVVLFILSMTFGRKLTQKSQVKTQPNAISPTAMVENTQEQTADESSTTQKTSLSITPKTSTLKAQESAELSVFLTGVPSSAIDIVLSYDPELISISDITKGPLFDRVLLNKVDEGKMYFSGVINPDKLSEIGEGAVVSFKVTGLAQGNATISFVQEETVTALNGQNTLGQTVPGTITVTK